MTERDTHTPRAVHVQADAAVAAVLVKNLGMTPEQAVASVLCVSHTNPDGRNDA